MPTIIKFIKISLLLISVISQAQNIRSVTDSRGTLISNTPQPDTLSSSAALEIRSNDKVFYPPRMSSNDINNINNPRVGATVYDTDVKSLRVFNGTSWDNNSLPKSTMILSEYYPNDTLTSAGYQYVGNINVPQTSVSPFISHVRTIPSDGAPRYSGGGSYGFFGVWDNNKLFITTPGNSIHCYDATTNMWNDIPTPPALNSGATIIYRGTLTNKYILVASDYTVYVYSIGSNFWRTFTYPTTGTSSITKVNNQLVFWKISTNIIYVFSGNSWYSLNGISGLPTNALTLEYNDNLVFLWNENGIINGKRVTTNYVGTNNALQSSFTFFNAPMSRDNYAYKVIGSKLVIWGGTISSNFTSTGSIYDLVGNTWTTINTTGAPSELNYLGIDSFGNNIVVYGGFNTGGGVMRGSGGIYNPITTSWTSIPNSTALGYNPKFFLHGGYLYFWDGYIPQTTHIIRYFDRLNLTLNQWEGYTNRWFGFAVNFWTGKYFVEWGGYFGSNSNATYNGSSGGNIYGTESFESTKRYYLYKKL